MTFDINSLVENVKNDSNPNNLGMILTHLGIVRGTSKGGEPVTGMILDYSEEKLRALKEKVKKLEFVESVEIIINKGKLKIGDDIMVVVLAGNNRKRLLPLFEEIIEEIKQDIVKEKEV